MPEKKEVAGHGPGEDAAASHVGAADRCLLVGFVVAMLAVIGAAAILYRPEAPDPICARTEARCGDHVDPAAQ